MRQDSRLQPTSYLRQPATTTAAIEKIKPDVYPALTGQLVVIRHPGPEGPILDLESG